MAAADGDLEGEIGSIRLIVDDLYDRVENSDPYTLFGDRGAGDPFSGLVLEEGQHTLQLEVFSGKNANGTLLGDFEIAFTGQVGGSGFANMWDGE